MVVTEKNSTAAPGGGHVTGPKYRPDIDGLRAIAVLSVVGFHAFPAWMPGGFIGVDIFFIISGFLISTIIFEGLDRGIFRFSVFYARRIKRIFPALLLVLLCSMFFGWIALYPDEYKQLGKHVFGGAVFISNILLFEESGYFDTAAEVKPLLHLWSLGVEEQYYIVWPLILWLVWKFKLNPLTAIFAALFASFSLNILHISVDPSYVFYMPHTRVWELLIGTLLAYSNLYLHIGRNAIERADNFLIQIIYSKDYVSNQSGDTLRNVSSFFGVVLLACGFYLVTSKNEFPGWWALVPCLGATLIIAAGPGAWFNKRILSCKIFVWIGLISFPLYLWHWPLLSFARIVEGDMPAREIRIAAVLLSLLLAWATYALIEIPVRRIDSRLKTAFLSIMMIVVGAAGYYIYAKDGMQNRKIALDSAAFHSQFSGPLWKYTKNDICLNRYPNEQAKSYGWWFCMTNRDEPPSVILLGSSFANHLYPGFVTVKGLSGNTTVSIGTCSLDAATDDDPLAVADVSPCSGNRPHEQRVFIKNLVENNKTLRYAVIDGLRPNQDSVSIRRVEEMIDFLKQNQVEPIIFVPHFLFERRDLKGCFERPFKSAVASCDLEEDVRTKIDEGFAPLLERLAESHPDVRVFDQNELFCRSGKCSPLLNGMPIYRDDASHYTEYASSEVAKQFVEWAKVHMPEILAEER